jgi:hypothetical protein
MYFEEVIDIFERDKEKAISMEMLLVDSEVDENDETLITNFCFTGVTLLGSEYNPAIPKANAEVVKYSDKSFDNLVKQTKELLFSKKSEKEVKLLDKKFNKKEFAEKYSLTANQMFEMFEKNLGQVKCKTDDYEYKKYYVRDFCGKYIYARDVEEETMVAIPYAFEKMKPMMDMANIKYARMAYVVMEEEEKEEDVIKVYEDKAVEEAITIVKSENEQKVKEFEEKLSTLETEKTELNEKLTTFDISTKELTDKVNTLEEEKTELVTFKENIEKQEKEQKINFAFESVKDCLNEKQIEE